MRLFCVIDQVYVVGFQDILGVSICERPWVENPNYRHHVSRSVICAPEVANEWGRYRRRVGDNVMVGIDSWRVLGKWPVSRRYRDHQSSKAIVSAFTYLSDYLIVP